MDLGSIDLAMSVAIPTINNSGRMKDLSRPVNSIIKTTAEIGPWVVAANTAPAPRIANRPAGTPGHRKVQAWPKRAPSKAPAVNEGVNSPPGVPLRMHSTVAAGLSVSKITIKRIAGGFVKST